MQIKKGTKSRTKRRKRRRKKRRRKRTRRKKRRRKKIKKEMKLTQRISLKKIQVSSSERLKFILQIAPLCAENKVVNTGFPSTDGSRVPVCVHSSCCSSVRSMKGDHTVTEPVTCFVSQSTLFFVISQQSVVVLVHFRKNNENEETIMDLIELKFISLDYILMKED